MKADITLALSMLCLVLLIPATNGTSFNDTQPEKTSARDGLLKYTSITTDRSATEKHASGVRGNHYTSTTDSPNGTLTSTENQTSETSGSPTQQTENTTPPPTPPPPQTPPTTPPLTPPTTPPTTPSSTQLPSGQLDSGSVVVVVLIAIFLLVLIVLFFYKWNTRHSGQDSTAPRLLLGVRESMRGGVRNLEDRLGLRLWPWKRVVEGDEEEGKSGVSAAVGVRVGQREEEGDSSDDYSSLDGIDLSERAKNREDEEKKEEAVKRKIGSEGSQDDMKGERTDGRKDGGEEERTVEIPGEEKREGDTFDLTAF